jgi:glycosyltransferase involved in cell wall biosynthesis
LSTNEINSLLETSSVSFRSGDFGQARKSYELAYNLTKKKSKICLLGREKSSVDLSIIIVVYKSNEDTIKLLSFLKSLKLNVSHETVIVINNDVQLRKLAHELISWCILIDVPVNLKASGGRNFGAEVAVGRSLLFIDDDGGTDNVSIQRLYDTLSHNQATSVRGRVLPKSQLPGKTKPHYDLGSSLVPSIIDIEGMTIWDGNRFRSERGFDGLLFGHEGFELFSRMFKQYGPNSFLYEPNAVLTHDFATDDIIEKEKLERYKFNNSYLDWLGVKREPLIIAVERYKNDILERAIYHSSRKYYNSYNTNLQRLYSSSCPLVSVITTAKNASRFLGDYVRSLKMQVYKNFEVIFVDDHSEDDSKRMMRDLWSGDERPLNIWTPTSTGRGACLQEAVSGAKGDFCIIADIDDIMVPERIAWTVEYFLLNPNKSCLSFYLFNEIACLWASHPYSSAAVSLRIRRFAGMPACFPSFGFVRRRFNQSFDLNLEAGLDCDWLYRNFEADTSLDGELLPVAATYYRIHQDQISASRGDAQRSVALNHVMRLHSGYLDSQDPRDSLTLLKLMRWLPITDQGDLQLMYDYIARFRRHPESGDDVELVRSYLVGAVEDLSRHVSRVDKVVPGPVSV